MITIRNTCDGSVSRLECLLVPINPTGPLDVKIWSLLLFMNVGGWSLVSSRNQPICLVLAYFFEMQI